jgi:acyl carrier protein
MDNSASLRQEIKQLMVENLMLQLSAEEIDDERLLFGPGSLGLDSVDALQIVVALDKTYGLKVTNPESARQILQSVVTIAAAVEKHRSASVANTPVP